MIHYIHYLKEHTCKKATVGENIIATIKMRNNVLLPFKNGNFSNIAIAILDFSLLSPI